jgi:hypothetical protein
MKPFFCTPVIVRRALKLVLRFVPLVLIPHIVSPDLASHVIAAQENISAKVGLILSFSLILIWGARLPVVSLLCATINPLADT